MDPGPVGVSIWELSSDRGTASSTARHLPGYKTEAKANGLRGDLPCAMGPLPATGLPEAKQLRLCLSSKSQVKSSQGLLFSEAKKPHAEAVGHTGAQGLVRGCGPHCPPVSQKNPLTFCPARDEASGAPRAGRGSASFSGLISGVRVLSPALSGGRPGFRGGNPISIDQRPKPRKEG